MTANWFEGVKQSSKDVDAYIATRHRAYLDRWNEALRFVEKGARVLDVGGGNLYPALLERLREHEIDYWYTDVDQGAVDAAQALAQKFGFVVSQFSFGFNDELKFDDQQFDAVFSSHCVEHSFDLGATFSELHRVIREDGTLLMAVPFGWELNPEHPYFFEAADWTAMVEDAGFAPRVVQVGSEYPEHGHDLFLAARRSLRGDARPRIDPQRYCKTDMEFVPPNDPRVSFAGSTRLGNGGSVICSGDWSVNIRAHGNVTRVLPIFERHAWSSIVEVSSGPSKQVVDLHSVYSYPQPIQFDLGGRQLERVQVRPIGKNPLSRGTEGVFHGALLF